MIVRVGSASGKDLTDVRAELRVVVGLGMGGIEKAAAERPIGGMVHDEVSDVRVAQVDGQE